MIPLYFLEGYLGNFIGFMSHDLHGGVGVLVGSSPFEVEPYSFLDYASLDSCYKLDLNTL